MEKINNDNEWYETIDKLIDFYSEKEKERFQLNDYENAIKYRDYRNALNNLKVTMQNRL